MNTLKKVRQVGY